MRPWRFKPMSMNRTLGVAALALAAIAAVAVQQHGSTIPARSTANRSQPASPATTPTGSVSAPASTETSSSPPALTAVFASDIYGLSIEYPAGWKASASRTPWTMPGGEYRVPLGDLIEDPTHEFLWLKLASIPLGKTPFDEWSATVFAGHECQGVPVRLLVDGVEGRIDRSCHTALVPSAGRGYFISAHLCPCELGSLQEWGTWFDEVVATVQLEPERAIVSN
jgi:hypothetical protein